VQTLGRATKAARDTLMPMKSPMTYICQEPTEGESEILHFSAAGWQQQQWLWSRGSEVWAIAIGGERYGETEDRRPAWTGWRPKVKLSRLQSRFSARRKRTDV